MAVICDLDGVIWLGPDPILGAADAVADLRAGGHRVLFVTNNSMGPVGEVEAKLAGLGIPAEGDVVTSAMAAASLLEEGQVALAVAGPGVVEELGRRGVRAVRDLDPGVAVDAVVVGLHLDFDYGRLRAANDAIRAGARFLATNTDATYPTANGPIPGGGALVAAVSVASGVQPVVAGKPHPPMAALVHARLGPDDHDLVMVGDRLDTDGAFARALGCPFGLVLSGVTSTAEADAASLPPLTTVAPDLRAMARMLLAAT